jgi:hypothetical protein
MKGAHEHLLADRQTGEEGMQSVDGGYHRSE